MAHFKDTHGINLHPLTIYTKNILPIKKFITINEIDASIIACACKAGNRGIHTKSYVYSSNYLLGKRPLCTVDIGHIFLA